MRAWRGRSLRVRLTLITAGLLCVTLAVGAVALTSVLSASRVAALDAIVRDRATGVAALAADDRLPPALPVGEPGEITQLLDEQGRVVASSPNASRTLPVVAADVLTDLRSHADGDLLVRTAVTSYDPQARVAVLPTTLHGAPATVVSTMPLGEVQGLLRALSLSLVGVVPVLTLLLAGVVWFVLGRALHPVEQLRRAAAQVARSGGPGSLPVHRTDDELAALARTLNEMLDRLEVSAARQRTFVADAAHELRSPLASLRTGIEVARAHPEAYPAAELAADLEAEVLRMQGLVDDLLLLARVGSRRLVLTDVDLADLCRRTARTTEAARRSRPVHVEVTGAGRASADEGSLARVLRNLLDNATRHAAGRVLVTVTDGTVVVEDDGNGLAEEDRERVFERFVRLGEARGREAGGSGLGLAIVREIAREHGGDVELAASPLGGLAATLRLPT